jgi:hypothetical protein
MEARLVELLHESRAAAENQLKSARSMNIAGLREATAARQDVQFELEIMDRRIVRRASRNSEVLKLVREIRALDERLQRMLKTTSRIFKEILPSSQPETYSPRGRIRGGW